MTFLASVFPSNFTIFDSQSLQLNCLRKKMRSKGDQFHTLSYIRSISMPGNRHSTLKEALFVDIRVATELPQPGLFASDEENKAFYRLLLIQSWSKSNGAIRQCPDVIAAFYQSEMEEQAELSDRMSMGKMSSSPPFIEAAAEESPVFDALQSHFRANPKFF